MGYWGRCSFLLVGLLIIMPIQSVRAERRAFVTGINDYTTLPRLSTAVNDASAAAETLRSLGFTVTRVDQPGYNQFKEKWREFLSSLKTGDTVVFYFGGHGLQVDGLNYLLLKDSPEADAGEKVLAEKSLNFHELMQQVETHQLASSLYILDACRVSPFPDTSARAKSGQSRGLAAIESLYGAFVMYSAGPDEEALDFLADPKNERNSVYARHLLPLLVDKKISLVEMAKRVQVQVEEDGKKVGHQQRPAYFDGILGHYYLANLESSRKPLGPEDRITGDNVIRVTTYSTGGDHCDSLSPPRVRICPQPRYGRILTRYETYKFTDRLYGKSTSCFGKTRHGVAIYYIIDPEHQGSRVFDNLHIEVKNWAKSPVVTVRDRWEVDLASKIAKRMGQPVVSKGQ